MTHNASLPFELSTESLAGWLKSLSALPPANAANQLNQTLKQLTRGEALSNALLPLLVNLTPLTLHLSNNLANLARPDAQSTTDKKAVKIAKLAIQLPRHLSLVFCQLAEHEELEEAQARLAIYHALQLIGYSQRNGALFYEMWSATLWKKTAFLYQLAVEQQWLEQTIPTKIPEFKLHPNIAAVIRRNLLFAISQPNRYSYGEISQLFELANQYQHLLEIGDHQATDFNFYWEADCGEPNPKKQAHWKLPMGCVAVNSLAIGHALQMGEIKTELPAETQIKLVQHLTGYPQIFASTIIGQPIPAQLLSGFASVTTSLHAEDKVTKIMRLSAQLNNGKSIARGMTLVPLENESSHYKSIDPAKVNFVETRSVLNLLRSHSNQYQVAESTSPNCTTGDIGLLCRAQQPAILVIVRQQSLYEDVKLILMEEIKDSVAIYHISGAGNKGQQAIIIGGETDHPEVFLPSGKYSLDSKILLKYGPSFYLKECVEHNDCFARFRIRFDS